MTQLDLGLPPDELQVVAGYDLGVEYAFQYHGPRASVGYARNFFHDRLQVTVGYDFQYLCSSTSIRRCSPIRRSRRATTASSIPIAWRGSRRR